MDDNASTCGLINLGSTCFLNATLQILSRCESFRSSVSSLTNNAQATASQICLATILTETFTHMHTQPATNPFSPSRLHKWITENTKKFPSNVQGDPLELIDFIVDYLDNMDFRHYEEISTLCSLEYHVDADEFQPFEPYGAGLKCQLEATDNHPTSTKELVNKYFNRRTGRECRYCDGYEIQNRRMLDPPNILIVSIGRNCTSNNVDMRNNVHCTPDTLLSIPVENNGSVQYRLFGAIEHVGGQTTSGHFKALVNDHDCWYCYSDEEVIKENIDPQNVYIMAYNRIENFESNEIETGVEKPNNMEIDVPIFTTEELRNAQMLQNEEKIQEFNRRYSESYSYTHFRHNRILLMCIPKVIQGNNFYEKYQTFLTSNLTILYTITTRNLYLKITKDPIIKEYFDVFQKKISSKIGFYNTGEWIAQAATSFIVHSLLYKSGPRFEFIFDLHPHSLIPKSILSYWESSKNATIKAMDRIIHNKLFCLYSCNKTCCEDNDPFHFSLKGMKPVECAKQAEPYSTIKLWSFIDNMSGIRLHPLKSLLTPMKLDLNLNITTQVSVKLNECNFTENRKVNVYLLMIVNGVPKHSIQDLKNLWSGTIAKFALYAGCTCTGRFRKDHLRTIEDGGISSVSKFLDSSSKIYLVMSQEFEQRKDAEKAEAQLIAVLKYQQLKEMKTGLTNRFSVLNVNNSYVPLYNSNKEACNEIQKFLDTKERLFIFQGETNSFQNDKKNLKCYLVNEAIN